MARVEGFYWVRERDEGSVVIAAFHNGEWTFGDGDYFADESNLDDIPQAFDAAGSPTGSRMEERYQLILKARKAAGQKHPTGGWDWLEGYYWVRVEDDPSPVLAHYLEGWGDAAGEREFDKVEIIDGPLVPPQIAKRGLRRNRSGSRRSCVVFHAVPD